MSTARPVITASNLETRSLRNLAANAGPVPVYAIEAARLLCAGESDLALALLRKATKEITHAIH